MSKNKNSIQLIGGSGFVGSRLISLIGKENCLNIDKNKSPFFNNITSICDIRNSKELVIPSSSDFVILLAAEHKDNVLPISLYYDVNVEGTRNVLKSMDVSGIKNLIFTSSVAVYGLNKLNPNENHNIDPFNHYGKSKWQAEQVIKEWYDKDPISKSVTIIRPTVIFGERNRGNVFNLLKQISSRKFIMIGKGCNKKSMAYVGNIVEFIKDRVENRELGYSVYNYADSPDFSMNELICIVEKKLKIKLFKTNIPYNLGFLGGCCFDVLSFLTRKKFSISSVRVKKFCATTQFNAQKAHNVFKSPYSLKQGLQKTLEHEFLNDQKDNGLFFSE